MEGSNVDEIFTQADFDDSFLPIGIAIYVPEPSSFFLVGTSLVALIAVGWRRNKKSGLIPVYWDSTAA